MFIIYVIGAILLSVLLGPHRTKPQTSVFSPPLEHRETPTAVVEGKV